MLKSVCMLRPLKVMLSLVEGIREIIDDFGMMGFVRFNDKDQFHMKKLIK